MILNLLIFLVGTLFPRFISIILYLFTDWFLWVFETRLWPIVGFLFFPSCMLWFSVVINWHNSEWNWLQVVVFVLAVILDLFRNAIILLSSD